MRAWTRAWTFVAALLWWLALLDFKGTPVDAFDATQLMLAVFATIVALRWPFK